MRANEVDLTDITEPTNEEIAAAAAEYAKLYPVDDTPAEPDPVALFHFGGGAVFVSSDYEPIGEVWQATGYFKSVAVGGGTIPQPDGPEKNLLIVTSALRFIEFEARS